MEWIEPLDDTEQDDLTRAVADRANAILAAARFMATNGHAAAKFLEVRIWIEAAAGPSCVSVTWEPGPRAFGFHVLDESLTERLGCIVFEELPCVRAEDSEREVTRILDAIQTAMPAAAELGARAIDHGVER